MNQEIESLARVVDEVNQSFFQRETLSDSLFRGWNVRMLGMAPTKTTKEVAIQVKGMGRSYTYLIDPLVAKNLKDHEGFDDPAKLSAWVADEMKTPLRGPEAINFIVVGGEVNPFWVATDFNYMQTVPIDPWVPSAGIKKDARPIRMPVPVTCKDGSCGLQL